MNALRIWFALWRLGAARQALRDAEALCAYAPKFRRNRRAEIRVLERRINRLTT
jgi:hypothetical protein